MSAVSLLTKTVIMDLFCFDINKNFLERNIDLILRFPDDYMGYYGIAQMTF